LFELPLSAVRAEDRDLGRLELFVCEEATPAALELVADRWAFAQNRK